MLTIRSLAESATAVVRVSTGELRRIVGIQDRDYDQPATGAHCGDRSKETDTEVPATYDRNVFADFIATEFPNLAADKISDYPDAVVWDVLVPRRHLRGVLHMAHEATGCRKAIYDKFCNHEKAATALINEILAELPFDGITVTCRNPRKLIVQLVRQ